MQPRAETGQSLLELLEAGQKGEGCQSQMVEAGREEKNRGFL